MKMAWRITLLAAAGWLAIGPGRAAWAGQAPSTQPADPPADQVYSMRLLVWNLWTTRGCLLDGPAGQAECSDLIKGHDIDDAGNIYWAECDAPVIRCYRRAEDRIVTLAGSIRGHADGPMARARFGGWRYNNTSLLCVSGDGRHLFVRDAGDKGLWKYVDLQAGTVTSLAPWHHYKGGYLVIVKDRTGGIYAFVTSGAEPPDCPGYTRLKVPPCKPMAKRWVPFDRYALDVPAMKFYFHCRGPMVEVDLTTGEGTVITATDPKARPINTSGPLATTTFLCPTGMALSPAGRFLYVGQGDGSSCFRLDLKEKQALVFGKLDGGGYGWRTSGRQTQMTGSTGWPAATAFNAAGQGAWATCWALYDLTPVKGGDQ